MVGSGLLEGTVGLGYKQQGVSALGYFSRDTRNTVHKHSRYKRINVPLFQ